MYSFSFFKVLHFIYSSLSNQYVTGVIVLFTVPMFYEKYDHKVDAFVEKAMAEIKKHYVVFKRMKRDLYSGSFNTFICASSLYSCIFIYPLCFICFTLYGFTSQKERWGEKDVKFGSHNWVSIIVDSVRILKIKWFILILLVEYIGLK